MDERHLIIKNLPTGYDAVLSRVRRLGVMQDSRNGPTLEVPGMAIDIEQPWVCGVSDIGRGANVKIPVVESLCLIAGESYPELLSQVSGRKFDDYRDGEVLHGAYGPRIRTQMPMVIEELIENPESRRAVAMIWNPILDLDASRRDLPCTLHFQFLIRDGLLEMVSTMRSNDAWRGFPYDVFQFAQLQCTVANCLGIEPGWLHHRVGSMHLYMEDLEASSKVLTRETELTDYWPGIDPHEDPWCPGGASAWRSCVEAAQWALKGKALYEDRLLLRGTEIVMAAHGVG